MNEISYQQRFTNMIQHLSVAQKAQASELVYMVFKDLSNVFGVYAETLASNQFFKFHRMHAYKKIAEDRFILQINLSNSILYDKYEQCKNDQQLLEIYKILKQIAKQYLERLIQIYIPEDNLWLLINHYQNYCLNETNTLNQIQSYINQNQISNQQLLINNLFQNMQIIDEEIQRIKQGEQIKIPDINQYMESALNRYEQANQKLAKNFSQVYDQKLQFEEAEKLIFYN